MMIVPMASQRLCLVEVLSCDHQILLHTSSPFPIGITRASTHLSLRTVATKGANSSL